MSFQGTVLTVSELLDLAHETPQLDEYALIGLRHTATMNAQTCINLLNEGSSVDDCWRFGVLQTLDDYNSTIKRGGAELASRVFADAPPRTGSTRIDAAFAALAEFLAERDEWPVPLWARDESRSTFRWFAGVPKIFRDDAERESPNAFRSRGVFITARSLARA